MHKYVLGGLVLVIAILAYSSARRRRARLAASGVEVHTYAPDAVASVTTRNEPVHAVDYSPSIPVTDLSRSTDYAPAEPISSHGSFSGGGDFGGGGASYDYGSSSSSCDSSSSSDGGSSGGGCD